MFSNIKTIVFDLDGTIYQDIYFYKKYIHFLVEQTEYSNWEKEIVAFCDKVFNGEKLKMNDNYEVVPKKFNYSEELFTALENSRCSGPGENTINLGDAWSVMALIGETLGLCSKGRGDEIFARTRKAMLEDGLIADIKLYETIKNISKKYNVILLSNSYESTAKEFLKNINFENVFLKVGFSSVKPHGMIDALNKICPKALNEPETIMTIGDHAYNDLEPLAVRGAKTIWINPYPNIAKVKCDIELKTTVDLTNFLETLIR